MAEINLPDAKFTLWTKMRRDLAQYVPAFEHNDTLLCPICCRELKYDQFSLEHMLPRQAVKQDPDDVRSAVPRNERSGLTLLCGATLRHKSKFYPKGCNGWKGRNFDTPIRNLLEGRMSQFSDTHIISLLVVGYLGLFSQYGYRIALTENVIRTQFFEPRGFIKELPLTSQLMFVTDPHTAYNPDMRAYWSEPVKVVVDARIATIVIRNYGLNLPLSHDPRILLAKKLPYAPVKHVLRPNLKLVL